MTSRRGPIDVLVTGSTGFVGSALTERLEAEGLSVVGAAVRAGRTPTVVLDITDRAAVREVFERLRPRKVVHAAAIVDDRGAPEAFRAVNVRGTEHVLEAAENVGTERLVHISSIVVLGLESPAQCDEHTPLQAYTGAPYMDTKAVSERRVRDAWAAGRVPAVVVRPGDVYGVGSEPWVRRPVALMRQRMPVLVGGGRGLMAHCWIDNLVDGLVLALGARDVEGGVFHVTDGQDDTTFGDYFHRLASAAGVPVPRRSLPAGLALRLGRVLEGMAKVAPFSPPFTATAARYLLRRSTYCIAATRRSLGYEPAVDLDEGMARLAHRLRVESG